MPILTLVCQHCGIMIIIGSRNKKAAEAIFDYGKINRVLGKPYELNCLSCSHPMIKARAKPEFSKVLSDSHNKCKCWHSKDIKPAEMINPNE